MACLRVHSFFYDQPPQQYGPHLREHVAHHQYMMFHIVYQLRKEFTVPPETVKNHSPSVC